MKKKSFQIAASLGFAQLALIGLSASAQDTVKTINVTSLDQVVVSATRSAKRRAEIGKVVRVITSEQLQRSQGRNLPEILNNIAGITYSGAGNAYSNNAASLFFRGASAGNTLVLVDGIPVNDAQSISNEYDLKSIPVDHVERIEIVKGGNSTLYGSDAVAGVINIITKQSSNEALNANVLLTAGSYHANKQAIGLNGSVGKTGVAFNYSHTGSKEFSSATDASGTGNFDKDGFDQHALNFNGKQQLTEKLTVNGNIQLSNNNGMSDGGSFSDDKDYTYKRTHFFGGVTGKYALEDGGITLNLSNNIVVNKFQNLPADGSALQRTDNKGRIWQADLFLNKELSDIIELNSGINYRKSNSDQYNLYDTPGYTSESILDASIANSDIRSFFASFFLKNLGGFYLELGGRYNHHSKYGDNFTYTINPSYVFANRYKLFLNASSAFKAPTLYQLFSPYGNTDLDPETSLTYEAGTEIDFIPSKLSFNAAFFQRKSKNLINLPISKYENFSEQNDKGFELELNSKPTNKLFINTWYSFVEGKGVDENKNETKELLRRPKHSAGASAGYTFSKTVSASLNYKYTGTRPDVFYDANFERQIINLSAYSLLDVYFEVKPLKKITLFGDFKNILDEDYIEWLGYNTRGSNVNVGIKYTVN